MTLNPSLVCWAQCCSQRSHVWDCVIHSIQLNLLLQAINKRSIENWQSTRRNAGMETWNFTKYNTHDLKLEIGLFAATTTRATPPSLYLFGAESRYFFLSPRMSSIFFKSLYFFLSLCIFFQVLCCLFFFKSLYFFLSPLENGTIYFFLSLSIFF